MIGKMRSIAKKIGAANKLAKAFNETNEQKTGLLSKKTMMYLIPCVCLFFLITVVPLFFLSSISSTSIMQGVDPAYASETSSGGGNSKTPENWDELYYNQYDEPWGSVIYDAAGHTIAEAGCGLCSITHVIDLLSGTNYRPDEISDQLREYYNGNVAVYAPGGSVVSKLAEFATGKYGFKATTYYNIDEALADMSQGNKVMILSDNGKADFIKADGGTYKADHVIMCYKTDGENCWVKDSGTDNANSIKYTKAQISQINFAGFTVIGK